MRRLGRRIPAPTEHDHQDDHDRRCFTSNDRGHDNGRQDHHQHDQYGHSYGLDADDNCG